MEQGLSKNNKASIIHLFQKMDSNVSKFRESIISSPAEAKAETIGNKISQNNVCGCLNHAKERKLQGQFFCSQYELVSRAVAYLEQQGNQTLSKLLGFMSQFLLKLCDLLQKELMCDCKRKKLAESEDLNYKISFLREQNHKFFKIIEEKTLECENLKKQLELAMTKIHQNAQEQAQNVLMSKSRVSEPSFVEAISSRVISSNSSRVSQFKHVWPELTGLMGEGGHKRYFEGQPADRQNYFKNKSGLLEKDLNRMQSQFRKPKIFDNNF